MRVTALLACGLVAACTSGAVTAPGDPILREVQPFGGTGATASASSSGGATDFTSTIESALADDGTAPAQGAVPPGAVATPLDADFLNLTLYTIEQQKIDARIAEQQLAEARSRLVVVEPGALPPRTEGVNIAVFAQQTSNAVGEKRYARSIGAGLTSACGRFRSPDDAQRAFLANGGPERDPQNLDPDGDGFACKWDPTPYRQIRL
jgi:hypothetical protein